MAASTFDLVASNFRRDFPYVRVECRLFRPDTYNAEGGNLDYLEGSDKVFSYNDSKKVEDKWQHLLCKQTESNTLIPPPL